ncbi:MAG: hypothetical protein Ta2A_02120 [Treponemataceae bacterium]|nr:MAG: hypothetical protein Ta2A_02120 [Treponemataceae bacterium]
MKNRKTILSLAIKCLAIILLCFIQIKTVDAFSKKIGVTTAIVAADGSAHVWSKNEFEDTYIKIINQLIVSAIMVISLFIMYDFLYLILGKTQKPKYKIITIIVVLLLSIFFTSPDYFIWLKGSIIPFFLRPLSEFLLVFVVLLLVIKLIRRKKQE